MTPLVEREREVAALAALLDALPAGEGRVAWIEGPAGIGKSALLAGARRHAAGVQVLAARGSELEREFPFGVVRQLFEAVVTDPERRERVLGGAAAPAGAVFGEAAMSEGDVSFAALHGLFWVALNLAAEGPLLLAIDDLHWCDRPSLRFVAYLARRLEGQPILVAATVRTGEPGTDVALLGEIAHDPATVAVRPVPLSAEAVRVLVRERLGAEADDPFCAACHEATGGNPLFLRQLLTALEADHVRPDAEHAPVVLEIGPRAVSRTVIMRLARLSEDAIAVARGVAVLAESATLPAVAALTGLSEARVADATGMLARAEILRREAPIAFVHALVRDAVYQELPLGERELQHERAARVLLDGGALRAARGGRAARPRGRPASALRLLSDAGLLRRRHAGAAARAGVAPRSAGRHARRQDARRHCGAVVELHGRQCRRVRRAGARGAGRPRAHGGRQRAVDDGGPVGAREGRPPEADPEWAFAQAEAHRHGSILGISSIHLWHGFTLLQYGDLADAEDSLRHGQEEFDAWGFDEVARRYTTAFLARVTLERGRVDDARAWLAHSPPAADENSEGSRYWRSARVAVLVSDGRWEEALDAFADYRRHHSHVRLPTATPARANAAVALDRVGRHEEALALAEEELADARRWGAPGTVGPSLRSVGVLRADVALLEEAVTVLERSHARLELAKALADLGAVLRRERRPSDAREPLRRALELADACAAGGLVEHVRSELYAAGARPRTTALGGVDALTASERRVAAYAAEGQSNRDIAQALFVTPKTVEVHLSNAYRKLGIRSRRDLASALASPSAKSGDRV